MKYGFSCVWILGLSVALAVTLAPTGCSDDVSGRGATSGPRGADSAGGAGGAGGAASSISTSTGGGTASTSTNPGVGGTTSTSTGGGAPTDTTDTSGDPPTAADPFVLSSNPTPLVAVVGKPFTIAWTLSGGATPITCAGSFTGAPAGALMSDWVKSAPAQLGNNSRVVTPAAADVGGGGNPVSFSLTLTCSNADGAITSAALPVTIQAVDPTCPPNRLTHAKLCYRNVTLACTTDNGADNLTTLPMWLGRYCPSDQVILPTEPPYIDFPGPTGAGPTFHIAPDQYVSAQFTVPSNLEVGRIGKFTKTFGNISNYTMADFTIGSTCGDFDSADIQPGCKGFGVPNDGVGIRWIIETDSNGRCRLNHGQTYYLNVRPTTCTNATCQLRIDG